MRAILRKAVSVICLGVMIAAFATGCGAKVNYKESLPGEWFVWHWYYNEKDGDNGFFDDAIFYTFNEDGSLVIADQAEGAEEVTASYVFTGDDTIEITNADGSVDSMVLAMNDDGQIQMTNVDNKYTLTLEPMSSWHD